MSFQRFNYILKILIVIVMIQMARAVGNKATQSNKKTIEF